MSHVLVVETSFLLNDKKVSTKKRENNANNEKLFRYFFLYTRYFRSSSFSSIFSFFLCFQKYIAWLHLNKPQLSCFKILCLSQYWYYNWNYDDDAKNLTSCYLITEHASLSLQVLKNYFPRISRIVLLCFENCWHQCPTIKSPRDFENENFPATISPTEEALETDDYIYLFINSSLLFYFGVWRSQTKNTTGMNATKLTRPFWSKILKFGQSPRIKIFLILISFPPEFISCVFSGVC